MSAVEILEQGAQARTGASDAFDASGFSTLRLDLFSTADHGLHPFCHLYIETASASAGPWRVAESFSFTASNRPDDWPTKQRVVLAGFDSFVRLRWSAGRQGEWLDAPETVDIQLVVGLSGDGQPDAV